MKKRSTKRGAKSIRESAKAYVEANRDSRFCPAHVIEAQPRKGSDWEDFKYTHHDKDMIDPRPTAREIKRLISDPETPWLTVLDIRQGVELMMYAAGRTPVRLIPLHVQYLAAMQYVSDYYGGLLFTSFDAVDRVGAVIRAALIVRDALKATKKGGA